MLSNNGLTHIGAWNFGSTERTSIFTSKSPARVSSRISARSGRVPVDGHGVGTEHRRWTDSPALTTHTRVWIGQVSRRTVARNRHNFSDSTLTCASYRCSTRMMGSYINGPVAEIAHHESSLMLKPWRSYRPFPRRGLRLSEVWVPEWSARLNKGKWELSSIRCPRPGVDAGSDDSHNTDPAVTRRLSCSRSSTDPVLHLYPHPALRRVSGPLVTRTPRAHSQPACHRRDLLSGPCRTDMPWSHGELRVAD